jgi:hypothetical protein
MKTAKGIGYVALLFTLLALTADPLVGAVEKSDWGSLKQIAAGQTIKVTVKHGASSQGDFQSATEDALLLRVAGEDRSIARDAVRRVSIKTNSHRGKHALIGAAIGAAGGLGAGIAVDNALGCSPNAIFCTGNKGKAIATPGFALIGAGIGALLPAGGWHEIYRAR